MNEFQNHHINKKEIYLYALTTKTFKIIEIYCLTRKYRINILNIHGINKHQIHDRG